MMSCHTMSLSLYVFDSTKTSKWCSCRACTCGCKIQSEPFWLIQWLTEKEIVRFDRQRETWVRQSKAADMADAQTSRSPLHCSAWPGYNLWEMSFKTTQTDWSAQTISVLGCCQFPLYTPMQICSSRKHRRYFIMLFHSRLSWMSWLNTLQD